MSTTPADAPVDTTPAAATPLARVPRDSAWAILIGGLLGVFASAKLALEYMKMLGDDSYVSTCDINELIGCGQFLGTPQAQAFGFPNVVIGMVAFPVVVMMGALLISRVQLPRWIELGYLAGTLFGIGFVTWLQYQAFFTIKALCPYCLIVWLAMIPTFVHSVLTLGPAQAADDGAWRTLKTNRWLLVIVWYLIVVAVLMIALREDLMGMI